MMQRLAALGFALLLCLGALPARAAVEVVRVVSPGGVEGWWRIAPTRSSP